MLSEEEIKVLTRAHDDMLKAKDINSINKIYRQVRTWNRWHSIGLERNFKESREYCLINDYLKTYRIEARNKLEGNEE